MRRHNDLDLQNTGGPRGDTPYPDKARALAILATVVILLSGAPAIVVRLWTESGRSKDDFVFLVLLPAVQLYVMLLAPLVFSWLRPELGAFEYGWFQWRRGELGWASLLVLARVVVMAIGGVLRHFLHARGPAAVLVSYPNEVVLVWAWIETSVLAPFAEEVFWRGYVQSTLARCFRPSVGIVFQATVFGLGHPTDFIGKLQLCLVGLVYGIWCQRRKTLGPVVVVHSANNIAFLVASGFRVI